MNTRIGRYSEWATTRRKTLLLILATITLIFMTQASQLKVNASPYFLDENHESRKADHWVKSTFSNSGEVMMIATITKQEDIFNYRSLKEIYSLTEALENLTLTDETDVIELKNLAIDDKSTSIVDKIVSNGFTPSDRNLIPRLRNHLESHSALNLSNKIFLKDLEVRLRPVRKVRNVVRIESISSVDDELDIHPMMYNLPTNDEELKALKAEALGNPLLENIVFSRKPNAVNNFIELNILQDDAPNMRRFYSTVATLIEDMELSDSYHLGGPPAIFAQTSSIIKQDSDRLFPGIFLVVMIVLFALFRDMRSVFMPLCVAVLSVIWTLGTMAFFGYKQNLVSTIMPVFLISIGVADSIHYLTEYRRQRLSHDHISSLRMAILHLWKPMLMTTITTMVGFFSLAYTEIGFIQEFGIFVALGVLYAYFITVTLLPALVGSMKESEKHEKTDSLLDKSLARLITLNTNLVLKRRRAIYLVAAFSVFPIYIALTNLQVDNEMIGYFDEESRIFKDNETIKQHFAGASSVEFTLKSDTPDFFKTPESIQILEDLEKALINTAHVNAVYSLADFLKLINREVTDGKKENFRIPYENPSLLPQYYLLYESSNGDDINGVVDGSYQNSRLVAFLDSDQTSKISHIVDVAHAFMEKHPEVDLTLMPSGFGNVLMNTRNEVISSQVYSLGLSFIGIFILLSILFKSPAVGVIGIIPLTFTVLINFSFMSMMGLFLDVGTAIVAPIAIGVGVDYAIYFLNAVKRQRELNKDMQEAISESLKELYRPIGFNTLVLGLGFLVLNLSSHESLIHLGMLISSTMLFSAIITLTLLPSIIQTLNLFPTKSQVLDQAHQTQVSNDSNASEKQS